MKSVIGIPGWHVTGDGKLWSTYKQDYIGECIVNGYKRTSTRIAGQTVAFNVHMLVCAAYHGPRPSDGHQCNHKDGDKLNNHPDNLEWVTQAENMQHAWSIGIHDRDHDTSSVPKRTVKQQVSDRLAQRGRRK